MTFQQTDNGNMPQPCRKNAPTTTTTTKQTPNHNPTPKTNPPQTPQKNAPTKKPTTTTKTKTEKQDQLNPKQTLSFPENTREFIYQANKRFQNPLQFSNSFNIQTKIIGHFLL